MTGNAAETGPIAPARVFFYSPATPMPRLVFTGSVAPRIGFNFLNIVDFNPSGQVLFESYTPETDWGIFVAERGRPPALIRSGLGWYPLALSDQGAVFSLVFEYPHYQGDFRVALDVDGGTVTGSSCPHVPLPVATPQAMQTPSATATRGASATPTATLGDEDLGGSACIGDCGRDGVVSVSELVRIVKIALGAMLMSECSACDANGDGRVGIDEMVTAVDRSLYGCKVARANR